MMLDETLRDLYSRLCIKARFYARCLREGTLVCAHCGAHQRSHNVNGSRCSISSTYEFQAKEKPEIEKVAKALELLEELQKLSPL